MILALWAGLAMLGKDLLGSASIVFLAKDRYWLGGMTDGLSDIGAVLSVGIGGVAIVRHGLTAETAAVLGAIWVASVLGTRVGAGISARISASMAPRGVT